MKPTSVLSAQVEAVLAAELEALLANQLVQLEADLTAAGAPSWR